MTTIKLIQLPVPPPAYYAATGNVPLAAASLASSLSHFGGGGLSISASTVPPEETDRMGDEELVDHLLTSDPEYIGFSLYLWNTERSLHLAREIKKKSKNTTIIIGGPEVNPDNSFLISETGYDVAMSGEAEHSFGKLIQALMLKTDLSLVENVSYRLSSGKMSSFSQELAADFPLTDFPSPYVSGFLAVDPNRSTYLETVRGCKSQCTYCFYPKSSQNLRTLDTKETVKLITQLKDRGAKELVFLDPTFNHRPGFENFLDAIAEVNFDKQMSMFAELRSEGITANLAKKLYRAGFTRIELGMQSINLETLKRVKRYGDPQKVAEVAKMLVGEGMELLLDLIIGLPGDTPDDVERGIHFFLEHGLAEWGQAFPLSLLPGTAMRRDAEKEGLIYLPFPPYRIIRTPNFSEDALQKSLFLAEDLLDRRLDEFPRPFLCEKDPHVNDVYFFDLDLLSPSEIESEGSRIGSRHQAVWFSSGDWESKFSLIKQCMEIRLRKDPFCTIDFVFLTETIISKQFIEKINRVLAGAIQSYLTRVLSHRDENMQHRVILVLKKNSNLARAWKEEMRNLTSIFLYEEKSIAEVLMAQGKIGISEPLVWVSDKECPMSAWERLTLEVDPEGVSFKSRELEKWWSMEVLGYGEN